MNDSRYCCPFLPGDPVNLVSSQRKCPTKHKDVKWNCPLAMPSGECAFWIIANHFLPDKAQTGEG